MSYDIYLVDANTHEILLFDEPHHLRGGTYCVGGTTEAWLNITWNYSSYFHRVIDGGDGIRFLYGKTGKESIPILAKAIAALSDDVTSYWEATEGNARRALADLLFLAIVFPKGIWKGD